MSPSLWQPRAKLAGLDRLPIRAIRIDARSAMQGRLIESNREIAMARIDWIDLGRVIFVAIFALWGVVLLVPMTVQIYRDTFRKRK